VRERLKNTDILVIDEVSMLSAELFEKINKILQAIRRNTSVFGGIQLILSGDFYQLMPIFNRPMVEQDKRLIFESELFNKCFKKSNTVVLKENFRHNDPKFQELLLRIRKGEQTQNDIETLKKRMLSKLDVKETELERAVYLVASNKRAQVINTTNMNMIKGETYKYESEFEEKGNNEICLELRKELYNQFSQKGINELILKKGARVMLIKNLSVEDGLVNGSVGTIEEFVVSEVNPTHKKMYPVVLFDNGIRMTMLPVEFSLEYNEDKCVGVQIPLMLCWAITVHRSQSLTLDKAVMDLGSAFCEHQVYVALSRVRSLNGLYLESFDPQKIMVNKKVKDEF
jgi:ATP-dependent DNA helicase PIF1